MDQRSSRFLHGFHEAFLSPGAFGDDSINSIFSFPK
jgi:hypothetical protein